MTLARQLEATARTVRGGISAEQASILDQGVEWLRASGLVAGALRCGELAPDFELDDAGGERVALARLLDLGPTVIAFFCGSWCPYCQTTLAAYRRALPEIVGARGTFLAISPERHDRTHFPHAGEGAVHAVLSDTAGRVAKLFGLLYALPAPLVQVYRELGIDLPAANGSRRWELPIPATYVVDTDGTAVYAFVDADPTRRAEPDELARAMRRFGPAH